MTSDTPDFIDQLAGLALINSTWNAIPHDRAMRSMRLFAEKVMPKVHRQPARSAAE